MNIWLCREKFGTTVGYHNKRNKKDNWQADDSKETIFTKLFKERDIVACTFYNRMEWGVANYFYDL